MAQLRRDGVALFYEEKAGEGRPLVFIHGWCCDHSYFAPQFAHFAERGHRVVSLDLRGHGASEAPRQDYTMQDFADDVAFLCGEIGVMKPVLVGHSMGGVVAYDIGVRHPQFPEAVVMVDAPVTRPEASFRASSAMLERLYGADYRENLASAVSSAMFRPTDDPERKSRIVAAMTSTPQHVIVSAYRHLLDYDPGSEAGRMGLPGLYVGADDARPLSEHDRLLALAPRTLFGKTVGSGHFCQLEVPDQLNPMIERFLRVGL